MSEEKENEEIQEEKRKTNVFVFEEFSYDVWTLKHHGRTLGGIPMYEDMALQAMAQHYEFYGQLNDVTQIQGYVTRNSVIHCDCGDHDIRLDAYEDHGIMDVNNEPVLTCNDCQADINIYRFGLCDAEQKYGRLSRIRPSGEKEMNKDGVLCYRCIPVLAKQWMQKDGDLLIWDAGSEEFVEALKAGAYLTCRFGGKIEVIEVPENEPKEEIEGIFHCTNLVEWMEYIEKPRKKSDYLFDENNNRIAIKPHCAEDKCVTIGYGHAIQSQEDAEKYKFETYQYSSNEKVRTSIEEQLKKYGEDLSNPAILTFAVAENLLKTDLVAYQDEAERFTGETGLSFNANEMDAITSTLYNGNKAYDPNNFLYYLLKQDKEGAINILHEADAKGWYAGREGTLRRRLMEYNIFFNGNYDFYEDMALDKLKEDVGW